MGKDSRQNNISSSDSNKFVNELIQQITQSQKLTKELVSNDNYIRWLEEFTSSRSGFLDNEWLYNPEGISPKNAEKIDQFQYFVSGIMDYANRNFIPYGYDGDESISIKFNGIGYDICRISGQGTYCGCHRTNITPDKHFIDFNDIISNKVQDNVAIITEKLDTIASIAKEILELGAPKHAISSRIKTVLHEYVKGGEN